MIFYSLAKRLARLRYVQEAMAEETSLDIFRKPPSALFLLGLLLIGFSYVIGWPAVAFFAYLAVQKGAPEIALWGPTSYLISHVVFLIGMGISGVSAMRYGNTLVKWALRTWMQKHLGSKDT